MRDAGGCARGVGRVRRRCRAAFAMLAALGAIAAALASGPAAVAAPTASTPVTAVPPAAVAPAAAPAARTCGSTVDAQAPDPRQINLVIDDSGSMFSDGTNSLDRWSEAKYSLEVFAAMMGSKDALNVYRMSDFDDGASAGPRVVLSGSDPVSDRVAKIHAMQMVGGGTPYAPVQRAYTDLAASSVPNKWLVILTDGEFDDRPTADVESDLHHFATRSETGSLQVAFLGIGSDAATIADEPAAGIHSAHAASSSDLLRLMTGFSNLIFQRNIITQTSPGRIDPDIPLTQALVFAQGPKVAITQASSGGTTLKPESVIGVSWAQNQPGLSDGTHVPAVPNKSLQGKIATFSNVPAGNTVFAVTGAQTIDIFYTPQVRFGIQMQDASGHTVDASKIVGGKYTMRYGFMDKNCAFIKSDLLGQVDYSARISHGGQTIADNFASGDTVSLPRGQVTVNASAQFLGTDTSRATITLHVLEPARPSGFQVRDAKFQVSKLPQYTAPKDAIALTYRVKDGSRFVPFSAQEWSTITPSSFHVTSTSNLTFTVVLGTRVGEVYLLPHAPKGDVYAADTGRIPVHVSASHVFDEQLNQASTSLTTTVVDDLPWYSRLGHWFAQTGWKIALGLLALAVLLGYLFKRRFSKRMKRRPTVTGIPNRVGVREETAYGKFLVRTGRKLLPFVPDAATLTYVPPGVVGFRPMRLKAGPHGSAVVDNWRQLAERKNVAINGTDLDEDTRRAPTFGASSTITANTPQMTYELTPNS